MSSAGTATAAKASAASSWRALRLEHDGDRVRLITRGGYNWTDRYPWIVEAARKVRQKRFVLDREAVVLGVDSVADFDALHNRKRDAEPVSAPST